MNRVIELETKIKDYAQKYYEGNTEISDYEFDKLVDELRELNPDSDILKKVGWGFDVSKVFGEKSKHLYQLVGSLDKARSPEYIRKSIISNNFMISAKLDGMSVVAYYRNGKLTRAITRGDGVIGIDRTDKLVKSGIVPIELNDPDFSGSVRGELVIPHKNWSILSKKYPDAKNSRNFAAGIIGRNETDEDVKYIHFVPYNVTGAERQYPFISDIASNFEWIGNNFEHVVPHLNVVIHDSVYHDNEYLMEDNLKYLYKELGETYPVDGLVITAYDLGYDNKAVIYDQIAYKFESDRKPATVKRVRWNLTRTAKMTPVLELEPIELCGATITHATAFNAKYIADNKIGSGTVVEIERSGEVIPDIQRVINTPYKYPEEVLPHECPVCKGHLSWFGTDLVCNNLDCSSKSFRDFQTWTIVLGRVDGLSWTLMSRFFDELNIYSISDIYDNPNLRFPDGYGVQKMLFNKVLDKLVNEPVEAVEALCALNIPKLGKVSAGKLVANETVMKALLTKGSDIDESTLYESSVGPATIQSIIDNKHKLDSLKLIKDRVIYKKQYTDEEPHEMVNVAVTGKLSVKRSDFEKELNDNGYVIAPVNKDCKFLITDNPTGTSSKNRKASELGIEKITEAEFRRRYMNE